ncbi:MAG: hypothetical protein HYR55_19050 [Acidobacteria bacterium]|nr:hypothetical protein [Acidobacteriota bacterium]MBI3658189.1 hypothetical protein [Acidobacteriota bacterium]
MSFERQCRQGAYRDFWIRRLWAVWALGLAGGLFLTALCLGSSYLIADDEMVAADEEEDALRQYFEWLYEERVTERGVQGSLLKAWKEGQNVPNNDIEAFWEPIGPAPLFSGLTTRLSGRINSVAVHPNDPNTIYLGTALGGVWKTTDGGKSWTPRTDDQPSLAMGSVAIDPQNPEIIYAGTGEQNFVQDAYDGLGVLKSTDGGTTWRHMGEDVFVNPNGGGARISRVVIDHETPSTVYVASNWGLFKSTDGGESWSLKLSDRGLSAVNDLVMDPGDSNTLYAGLGLGTLPNNKGIYKSTDRGETWALLDLDPELAQTGRINLALAPSNPQIIYAGIHRSTTAQPQMYRLKSTDGGKSWLRLDDCRSGCNQGSFNNVLSVHPENPDIVYHGAVQLFRSTDGGKTWSTTTRVHTDHHALAFDKDDNLYIGSDGGLFRINTDDTTSNLNGNLAITQFYAGVALHPSNRNTILAGSQDNGSTRYRGDSSSWIRTCSGDGMFQAIEGPDGDPDNNWYCAAQNLSIRKTSNDGRTFQTATTGLNRQGAAFIAPYIIDPNNSNVLIAATRSIWRTENGAAQWELNGEALSSTAFRSLAFAPLNSDTTYYAGATGRIWRTTDTGRSWDNMSQGLPNRSVTQIRVSPLDSLTVYATIGGFGPSHVFRTTDAGLSWTDISGNLPNVPATALLLFNFAGNAPTLFIGTDIGVFRSLDDGMTWERFGAGLPNVRVEDLVYSPGTGTLVASTHGRSMWRLNFGK